MNSPWIDNLLAWIAEHPAAAGGVIFAIAFCDAVILLGAIVPALPLMFAVGVLIGLGGVALAFITMGKQLLFFSPDFVMMILTPLLFLMAGAFALGFAKKG